MKWRVVMEVIRADGAVHVHEIGGGAAVDEYSPGTVGLTLAEGKLVLAGLQHDLVQAQTEDHCWRRRRCQRCGAFRPIKDKRSRRLLSLFGTVNVSAPRFEPCRCAVTRRQTLSPVSEIMPDRCTPEYERVVAKMGATLPYRRARTLLSEFLPLLKAVAPGDVVTVTRIDRLAPLDLRPVRHRQADRGRQGTVSVTGGAVGRYCHQHRAADDCRAWGLADVERDLICTRTAEGRSRAKARGQHMSTRRVYKWVTGTVENL
jgi:hypothetical protein